MSKLTLTLTVERFVTVLTTDLANLPAAHPIRRPLTPDTTPNALSRSSAPPRIAAYFDYLAVQASVPARMHLFPIFTPYYTTSTPEVHVLVSTHRYHRRRGGDSNARLTRRSQHLVQYM